MEKYKDFDVGDVYYHSSNEFYAYIFIDESYSKIGEIKSLINYFGGCLISTGIHGLIMASNFKTKEQAIYFKKILIMEYG